MSASRRPADEAIESLFPGNVVAATVDPRGGFDEPAEDATSLTHPFTDSRRRDFLAGRACARLALGRIAGGAAAGSLSRQPHGGPAWPDGFVGAITHCEGFVAAVVAERQRYVGIGIDAEPARRTRAVRVLERYVCTDADREGIAGLPEWPDSSWVLLVFCAKEALYKAVVPALSDKPGFKDVSVAIDPVSGSYRAEFTRPWVDAHPLLHDVSGRFQIVDGILAVSAYVPAI